MIAKPTLFGRDPAENLLSTTKPVTTHPHPGHRHAKFAYYRQLLRLRAWWEMILTRFVLSGSILPSNNWQCLCDFQFKDAAIVLPHVCATTGAVRALRHYFSNILCRLFVFNSLADASRPNNTCCKLNFNAFYGCFASDLRTTLSLVPKMNEIQFEKGFIQTQSVPGMHSTEDSTQNVWKVVYPRAKRTCFRDKRLKNGEKNVTLTSRTDCFSDAQRTTPGPPLSV